MKLAAVQYRPPKGAPERAREELAALVERALRQGARLVVCPEMATSGYVWTSKEEILPHCEPARGPTFQRLRGLARQYGAWVICGFPERAPEGLYNSALVIDERGELAACYRKVLLFEADETWSLAGRERPLFQTPLGSLTPAICMDLNDDDFARHLLRARPEVVAFCTNWVEQGLDMLPYWRWRMAGWRGWFVAADCWGQDEHIRFYGRSAILAPGGAVAGILGPEGDEVLVVDTGKWRP